MRSFHTIKAAISLFFGVFISSFCTHPEVADDFTNLKAFDQEISRICGDSSNRNCSPQVQVGIANGHVISIVITGRRMDEFPKSAYQFQNLNSLSLYETAFDSLPDLRPFTMLRELRIENNRFHNPLRLRNLPPSLEQLSLNRDGIREVVVQDTLPVLSTVELIQNSEGTIITPSFCKLPKLDWLDVSAGCCLNEQQQLNRVGAVQRILCKRDIIVHAHSGYID